MSPRLFNLGDKTRRRRRIAHAVWAAIAITVSLFMIFTKQRGDPPLMVFVPLVWIIWVVGHFVIWAVQWLAARGRHMVSKTGGVLKPWPIALRLALIGTGIPAGVGVFQVLMTGLQRKWYPYPDASLWAVMFAVWLVHGICFSGMLLRQQWSRIASAMLACGWALLLAKQIVEHLPPRVSSDTKELMIAVLLIVLLLLFGLHLVVSRKVKTFFTQ
jgi:hypothetical protein